MRFGPWYPLSEAASHAPETPGVFQVKTTSGLIRYPRGLSAMVHYEATKRLSTSLAAFARSHLKKNEWRCRFVVDPNPVDLVRSLCDQFVARFGKTPSPPLESP